MTLLRMFVAFFATKGARLDLMKKMLHVTGAIKGLEQQGSGDKDLRSAISACLACPHGDICKAWTSTANVTSLPPEFCMNAARLRRLSEV